VKGGPNLEFTGAENIAFRHRVTPGRVIQVTHRIALNVPRAKNNRERLRACLESN
jgi:hypothetical protein